MNSGRPACRSISAIGATRRWPMASGTPTCRGRACTRHGWTKEKPPATTRSAAANCKRSGPDPGCGRRCGKAEPARRVASARPRSLTCGPVAWEIDDEQDVGNEGGGRDAAGGGRRGGRGSEGRARADRGEHAADRQDQHRSEEHTSELQSLMRLSYAVFCLKKQKTK